jgi:hypothetical protein
MKAEIKISEQYGFAHFWTLAITTKSKTYSFYLGQDVKFCKRVLKIEPQALVTMIGTNQLQEGTEGNKRLANVICALLELTPSRLRGIPPLTFCAE